MNIIIKTKNLELTEQLENFINKKIGALKKFFSAFENHKLPIAKGRDLFETFVEVEKVSQHHKKGDVFQAEIRLYLPGKSLFAKAHGSDVIKIINEVRDELEGEIRKYKSKVIELPIRKSKKFAQSNNF